MQSILLHGHGLQNPISRSGILEDDAATAGIDHHEWHRSIQIGAEQQKLSFASNKAETFSLQRSFAVAMCGVALQTWLTGWQGQRDSGVWWRRIGA